MDALKIQHLIEIIELKDFYSKEGNEAWAEIKEFLQEEHINEYDFHLVKTERDDLERQVERLEDDLSDADDEIRDLKNDAEGVKNEIEKAIEILQNA